MTAHILLVEYEQRYVDQIRGALAETGARIEIAGDLDRAVDICAHFEPQLVIITSVLPRLEISDAITQLRARAGLRVTPFLILMSGYGGGASAEDAARYGAQGIIERPFTGQTLAERVDGLLATAAEVGASQAIPQETLDAVQQHAGQADGGESLTSDELFGDILSDVERDVDEAAPDLAEVSPPPPVQLAEETPAGDVAQLEQDAPAPHEPTVAEEVAGAEETPDSPGTPAAEQAREIDDLPPERQEPLPRQPPAAGVTTDNELDETLARVLEESKPVESIRQDSSIEAEVDAMLSETLAGLDLAPVRSRQTAEREPEQKEPTSLPAADGEVVDVEAPAEELAEDQRLEPPIAEPTAEEPLEEPTEITADEAPPQLSPVVAGTQFGQYIIEEHIATGGMAEVYRARMVGMEGFQKTVAIKRILSQLTGNDEFVTMLIDEAKLAAQLNHNNIIHIYDLGKIDRSYFIAMEFIEGKDLRTLLQECREQGVRVPIPLALHIAALLASALDHAHNQKDFDDQDLALVHRDVSPQNVLISNEGDVKLCDFGIAKAASKAATTHDGALKGKLQYMSPEQAWGKDIDHRSDIFSLGLVLHEMLTGEKVFTGTSETSVLEEVRNPRISAPSKLNSEVRSDVDRIVLKSLEPDRENRYQSARELQSELEAVTKAEGWAPDSAATARLVQDPASAALIEVPGVEDEAEVVAFVDDETIPVLPAEEDERPAVETAVLHGLETEPGRAVPETARSRRPVWLLVGGAALIVVTSVLVYSFRGGSGQEPPTPTPVPLIVVPTSRQATETPVDEELREQVGQMAAAEVARREEELRRRLEEDFPTPTPLPPTETPTESPTPTDTPTETPTPLPPTPTSPPATATPIPVTPTPPVLEGEIVEMGPGVIRPVAIHTVSPEYPRLALQRRIDGDVEAQALVGPDGRVEEVRFLEVSPSGVGFDTATEEAVLQWRYKPPTKNGVNMRMWVQIHVPFKYGNQ